MNARVRRVGLACFLLLFLLFPALSPAQPAPPVAGYGRALEFAGDDYVFVPSQADINFAGGDNFTIALWVKPNGGLSALYRMYATVNQFQIYTYVGVGNRVTFALGRHSITWDYHNSTNILVPGRWTHLAFVKEGAVSRIYVNGLLDSQDAVHSSVTSALRTTQNTYIGYDPASWDAYLNGAVDEVRVWNAALNQSQIADWMYRETDATHPAAANQVLYFKMNEGAGTTLGDTAGGNNPGTMTSMEETDWTNSWVRDWYTDEETPFDGFLVGSDADGASADGTNWTLGFQIVNPGGKGVASAVGTNRFHYIPNVNATGTDYFTYRVLDGGGLISNTQAVRVCIRNLNDAPTASNDTATTGEDMPISIPVLANDSDVDGDPLLVSAVFNGAHGATAIDPGSSNVTYTPNAGWFGVDAFDYVIADGNGGFDTGTVTVTVVQILDFTTAGSPAEHDAPQPHGYGTVHVAPGTVLTNTVTTPCDEAAGTRYRCAGWTGTGSVPPAGVTNRVVVTVGTHSALTWNWAPQHRLDITAAGGTVIGGTSGWWNAGWVFDLVPVPDPTRVFDHWETNGSPAGSAVPLSVTIDAPKAVRAVFSSAFTNVTGDTAARFVSWELNRQTGTLFGNLEICNKPQSAKALIAPFWYAAPSNSQRYLVHPNGTEPSGYPYVDITARANAALPGVGDGDTALDPGECVVIPNIEFYSRDRTPPQGFLYAIWADPPGTAVDLDNRDTDRDGLSNREEALADTNPNDPDSCLKIRSIVRIRARRQIGWSGGSAATQYLEWAKDARGPWTCVYTNFPPTADRAAFTHGAGAARSFYRIRAQR